MTEEMTERMGSLHMSAAFIAHHVVNSAMMSDSVKDKYRNVTAGKSYRIQACMCSPSYFIDDVGDAINFSEADATLLHKIEG